MGASTNVTTVMYGTAWTSDTMLATTIQHLERQQARDGIRRVFKYDAEQVGAEVPAYGRYVRTQVAELGRQHPLIRTQYYLEEIDAEGGLFPAMRRALMRGTHGRQREPAPGRRYAFLIDVAGEEEAAGDAIERSMLANKKRDATALTIVELQAVYGELPRYLTVERRLWLGVKHTSLYNQIVGLYRLWNPVWLVIDATGVGAGLASFLGKAMGERVIPVTFSSKVKSDLGWNFVAIVETGRYQEYADDQEADTRQFWHEVEQCEYRVMEGPSRHLRWGVWETVAYDGLIAYGHDDLLISAALTSVLDRQPWPGTGASATVDRTDELEQIDGAEW